MDNEIGVILPLRKSGGTLKPAGDLGLKCCQVISWQPEEWKEDAAGALRGEMAWLDVKVSAFWAGWPGPRVWDFKEGPKTVGLVPKEFRSMRVGALMRAADFVKPLGIRAIVTHMGFTPENPNDPVLSDLASAAREVAEHCASLGLQLLLESGQETPLAMLRLIKEIGTDNLGVNLDPGNLVAFGKGNPVDALEVLGPYVRCVHVKDATHPVDPMTPGEETRLGEGAVDFPALVRKLEEIGFTGDFIIERRAGKGDEQRDDIAAAAAYLRELLGQD